MSQCAPGQAPSVLGAGGCCWRFFFSFMVNVVPRVQDARAACVGRGGPPRGDHAARFVSAPLALGCAVTHRHRRVCKSRSYGKTYAFVLFKTKTGASYLVASPLSLSGVSFRVLARRPAGCAFLVVSAPLGDIEVVPSDFALPCGLQ